MAYAALSDMIARFGEVEMIRLTVPEGQNLDRADTAAAARALADASAVIDSYLRRRYFVPLATPPAEIVRAACILARYDLAMGGGRDPSEPVRLARKDIIEWLVMLKDGTVLLDGALPGGDESHAMVSDRIQVFGADGPSGGGYIGGCFGWPV